MADAEHINMLERPLSALGFSKNFCERSKLMGYPDLVSILATKPADLFKRKQFSHIWLGELTKFLIEQDMLDLLQANPGKSRA